MRHPLRDIIDETLGWLGPTWEFHGDNAVAGVAFESYEGLLRGALTIGQPNAKTVKVRFEAKVPPRGVRLNLAPKSQGMLSPFANVFDGPSHLFEVGDVEVDRYFAVMGLRTGRLLLQYATHALRRLRRNGGGHEGFVRIENDTLQIALDDVTVPIQFARCLSAIGEIWRIIAKGAVDGIVPLDVKKEQSRTATSGTARKSSPTKKASQPNRESTSSLTAKAQRAEMVDLLRRDFSRDIVTSDDPISLRAITLQAQWSMEWGGNPSGYLSRVAAQFYGPANFMFALSRENFLTELGKVFGLVNETEIGVPHFDERFFIRTNDEDRLIALTSDVKYRSRMDALPFTEFGLSHVANRPTPLMQLELGFQSPWPSTFADNKRAIFLLAATVEPLLPAHPRGKSPALAACQRVLASLPDAQDDRVKFIGDVARCSYLWEDFSGSIEVSDADNERGTVKLEFSGRAPTTAHAFEIRPIRSHPPFPNAPALPLTVTSRGFANALQRRMTVLGVRRSAELLQNLVAPIDVLAEELGHNQFALRLCEGNVRARAENVAWDEVVSVGTKLLNFWRSLVAVR